MILFVLVGLAGVTELACHPGYATDLNSLYCDEREQELRGLCDGSVREAIRKGRIELCSFEGFRAEQSSRKW